MLFEARLLQQATDERLARAKAGRFQTAPQVVDWCCGLGGDLLALAGVASTTGVDRSQIAVFLARHNLRMARPPGAFEARVIQADVNDFRSPANAWFHIDPDRRRAGRRSVRLEHFSPAADRLEQIVHRQQHGAIKLAPASPVPPAWQSAAERHWLGDRTECKQQVLWFGDAARTVGKRTASAIDAEGQPLFEWVEPTVGPTGTVGAAAGPGRYLLEPHPAIIAGRLTDSLASAFQLQRIATDISYLTGDQPVPHGALVSFEILTTTRLKQKEIVSALQAHDCGPLEIKKRGVDYRLMESFARQSFPGRQPLTLVLTRLGQRHAALICRRLPDDSRNA